MSETNLERGFIDPPSHEEIQRHIDDSDFTGVKQWAFGVSVRIGSDPGRWELFNMIQAGHMWLSDYREEIQAKVKAAQKGGAAEDIDFVDLVKTPHRTRNNVQPSGNAEKLARINALHFGQLEKGRNDTHHAEDHSNAIDTKPVKLSGKYQEQQQPKPVPAHQDPVSIPISNNTVPTSSLKEEVNPYRQPSSSQGSARDVPFAVSTSTIVPATMPERRFGPRPLPPVPGGARSRAPSNASIMMTADMPNHKQSLPPSEPVNATITNTTSSGPVATPKNIGSTTTPSSGPVPVKNEIPAPRPASPASREDKDEETPEEMEVELEMPLNDTTAAFDRTSTFPGSLNRKPSFAALPELSPLRKSIRHTGSAELRGDETSSSNKDGGRPSVYPITPKSGTSLKQTPAATKSQSAVKPPSSSGTRSSVRPSSGWLKGTAVSSGLVAKEKTASNTAANAVVSASTTGSVKRKSNDLLGKSGEDEDVQQEERPSKAHKKDGSTYAMENDTASFSKRSLDATGDGNDTAERLLKLKGIAKIAVEDETRRMGPIEPSSQSRNSSQSNAAGSRPLSRTASEVKGKSEGDGSRMSVSDLVSTWEEKSPTRPKETKAVQQKGRDTSDSVLPKTQLPSKQSKRQFPNGKTLSSTTPPGSPSRPSQERQRTISEKQSAVPRLPPSQPIRNEQRESQQTAPSNPPPKPVYKPIPGPIFKPPAPKPAKKEEPRIFSRPPSYQFSQQSQPIVESQTTVDDEETEPLFEKPIKKGAKGKGKVDTEVFSQETEATEFTWGDPGLTAGWMGKGNDTIGEYARKQKMPGAFRDEEEETDWGTAEDGGTGDHLTGPKVEDNDDDMETGDFDDQEQEPQESELEEVIDIDDDDEMVMEDVEEPEPVGVKPTPAPVPAPRGIFAQVGSLASKAASTLGSLRAAAVAAEKEKAEKEKKEAALAARREATLQKKAEEEAKRKAEAEKKKKIEDQRRKMEKEKADAAAAALNRSKLNKSTTIPTMKKQPELKRPPSKLGLNGSTQGKPKIAPTPTAASKRAPTPTGISGVKLVGVSNTSAAGSTISLIPVPERVDKAEKMDKLEKLPSILVHNATKPGVKITWDETAAKTTIATTSKLHPLHPALKVQQQTTASTSTRVDAQVPGKSEGGIDENADLPDIRSEYSDSEDEDRVRSFLPPGWAQSPDLRQALEDMRTVNPDMIFGAMPQLRMDEIFPGRRKSKFRARTSSANWAGTDGVTVEEEIAYARRMGFEE